jgi:heme A synthase
VSHKKKQLRSWGHRVWAGCVPTAAAFLHMAGFFFLRNKRSCNLNLATAVIYAFM